MLACKSGFCADSAVTHKLNNTRRDSANSIPLSHSGTGALTKVFNACSRSSGLSTFTFFGAVTFKLSNSAKIAACKKCSLAIALNLCGSAYSCRVCPLSLVHWGASPKGAKQLSNSGVNDATSVFLMVKILPKLVKFSGLSINSVRNSA